MKHFRRSFALLVAGIFMTVGYQVAMADTASSPVADMEVTIVTFVELPPEPQYVHREQVVILDPFHEHEVVENPVIVEPEVVALVATDSSRCPSWEKTAVDAGWPVEHWDRLSYILYRESRCMSDAFNGDDPNSGSRGLSQVNGFWCRPSRYFPDGWLQSAGVLSHCDDLYDPFVNLVAAKAIYDYGVDRGNCPWGPWTTRNTKWC